MHKTDNSSGYTPIDSSLPDMQLALQGLKNSQLAVQQEIARQASSLEQLQASRRQRLESQVARLLPDFSGATLDALAQACPGLSMTWCATPSGKTARYSASLAVPVQRLR